MLYICYVCGQANALGGLQHASRAPPRNGACCAESIRRLAGPSRSPLHCRPSSRQLQRSLKHPQATPARTAALGCRSSSHALLAPRSGSRALSAWNAHKVRGAGTSACQLQCHPGGTPAAAGRPSSASAQLQGAVQTGQPPKKALLAGLPQRLRLGPGSAAADHQLQQPS